MKILIVEPHPDDALLSVFGATKQWIQSGEEVSIVSVSDKPKTHSKPYCEYIGAKFVGGQTFKDVDFKTHRIPFKVISEQGSLSYPYQRGLYKDNHIETYQLIYSWCLDLIQQYDLLVYPLGLLHPFHVLVNFAFEAASSDKGIPSLLYADMPYANKAYGKTLIGSATESLGISLYQEFSLIHNEVKEKLHLFHTLYRGESIHWDEPAMYENSEKLFAYGEK